MSNFQCTNYQCVKEGYFSDNSTSDCSTFIRCNNFTNFYRNASFLYPQLLTCPQKTLFSPHSKKCDSYYSCGGKDLWKGVYPCLNYNWASPVVPNPSEKNCTTYLSCQYTFSGTFSATFDVIEKKNCPKNTFFSKMLGKCYNNYECPQTNNTCVKDPCANGVGDFINYKSGQCQSFIECRDDSKVSNTYEPTYEIRHCPPGTLFSPQVAKCDRNYTCPTFPVNYCYPTITTTVPPKPPTTPPPTPAPAG